MIPTLLSFDVEPDGFFLDRRRPPSWRGFELSLPFVRALRDRLAHATGRPARFNWLLRMDPQVADTYGSADWIAREHRAAFDELESHGDEIGLHVHAYRWDAALVDWIIDHGNQAHVDLCLEVAVEAFAHAFGRPARAFRFGDRWTNDATLRKLEALGVRYDMTVEPGQRAAATYHPGKPFTGSLPDTQRVPRVPYQPAAFDFRVPAEPRSDGVWIIPVTTAPVRPRLALRAYYRLVRPERLMLAWNALLSHDPVLFGRIIDWTLDRGPTTHLSLVLRSQALAVPSIVRRIERNVDRLLARPEASELVWTTPEHVVPAAQTARGDRAGAAATA
jgi:peptidoglycan/xylan/chitin deacetylase (PgdA/CDA1 family)